MDDRYVAASAATGTALSGGRRRAVFRWLMAITLVSLVAFGNAATASATPPGAPPCDAAHKDRLYLDPSTGIVYKCWCLDLSSGAMIYVWRKVDAPVGSNITYQDSVEAEDGEAIPAISPTGGLWALGDFYSFLSADGSPYYHYAGHLAQDLQIFRWDGLQWQFCIESGWFYNQSTDYTLFSEWNVGLPCGSGWYGHYAGGFAYHSQINAWLGGWVWSDTRCFACGSPTSAPISLPTQPNKLPPAPPAPPAP